MAVTGQNSGCILLYLYRPEKILNRIVDSGSTSGISLQFSRVFRDINIGSMRKIADGFSRAVLIPVHLGFFQPCGFNFIS